MAQPSAGVSSVDTSQPSVNALQPRADDSKTQVPQQARKPSDYSLESDIIKMVLAVKAVRKGCKKLGKNSQDLRQIFFTTSKKVLTHEGEDSQEIAQKILALLENDVVDDREIQEMRSQGGAVGKCIVC